MALLGEVMTKDDLGLIFLCLMTNLQRQLTISRMKTYRYFFLTREFLPDITGLESKPKANVGEVKSQGFDGNFVLSRNWVRWI